MTRGTAPSSVIRYLPEESVNRQSMLGELAEELRKGVHHGWILVEGHEERTVRQVEHLIRNSNRVVAPAMAEGSDPLNALIIDGILADVAWGADTNAGANARLLGIIFIPRDEAARIAHVIERLLQSAECHESINLDLASLARLTVRSGIEVEALDVFPWFPHTPESPVSLRWKSAVRGGDGFFSTLLIRPVSLRISKRIVGRVTPNWLTLSSLALAISAALLLAFGNAWTVMGGATLMYFSLVLDCSDGEVARFTSSSSPLGAWLDAFTDRIKENLILLSLAIGSLIRGTDAFLVGAVAVALITTRHLANFAFTGVIVKSARFRSRKRPIEAPFLTVARPAKWVNRPGLHETSYRGWVSRFLHAPVSERWFLLIIIALLWSPFLALLAYSIFVGLSLVLTLVGWALRTRKFTHSVSALESIALSNICDSRFPGARRSSRWVWLGAPLTAIIEFAALTWLLFLTEQTDPISRVLIFIAVIATSWWRYELAYAGEYAAASETAKKLGGGWSLRTLFWLGLTVAYSSGWMLSVQLGALTLILWLSSLMIREALRTWSSLRSRLARA